MPALAGWLNIFREVAQSSVRAVGQPLKTAGRVGTATIGIVGAAEATHLGVEKFKNPDRSWGNLLVGDFLGKDAADMATNGMETMRNVTEGFSQKTDEISSNVSSTMGAVQKTMSSVSEGVSGIGQFFSNLTNGNALGMFGNFFSNLLGGKVGTMGVVGLVAAAILGFGRFGWLGKIGAALLAMLVIGGNSRLASQTQTATQAQTQSQQQGRGVLGVDPQATPDNARTAQENFDAISQATGSSGSSANDEDRSSSILRR